MFVRDFRQNPSIRYSLKLNEHQFYFLMSPDYRRYFMEKKLKDRQLADRIVDIVRLNKYPATNSLSCKPIQYVVDADPYFRQRIE